MAGGQVPSLIRVLQKIQNFPEASRMSRLVKVSEKIVSAFRQSYISLTWTSSRIFVPESYVTYLWVWREKSAELGLSNNEQSTNPSSISAFTRNLVRSVLQVLRAVQAGVDWTNTENWSHVVGDRILQSGHMQMRWWSQKARAIMVGG